MCVFLFFKATWNSHDENISSNKGLNNHGYFNFIINNLFISNKHEMSFQIFLLAATTMIIGFWIVIV